MSCIDIYAPGRCLTVPFLAEQIWLRAKGKELLVTEVYDFLLRVDDDRPLTQFCIASPHFCRKRVNGDWVDRAFLLDIGDWRTRWGWFYHGDRVESEHKLQGTSSRIVTLRVPNNVDVDPHPDDETWAYEGLYLDDAQDRPRMAWHEGLQDEDSILVMHKTRKSLYQVTLPNPLRRYVQKANRCRGQRWIRLLVEPVELSDFAPAPVRQESLVDFASPRMRVTTQITCPFNVRRSISDSLQMLRKDEGDSYVAQERVERLLLDEGARMPGTSTRIEDHRIMLAGCGVGIDLQGGAIEKVKKEGYRQRKCSLPPHGHDYRSNPTPGAEEYQESVHVWAGGSLHNAEFDIETLANRFVKQIRDAEKYRKKQKDIGVFAREVTPDCYEHGCYFIEKTAEVRMLRIDDEGNVSSKELTETEFKDSLCRLRQMYLDPGAFSEQFRAARTAFSDVHPFSIEFTGTWPTSSRLRSALSVALEVAAIIALIVSTAALIVAIVGL